MAEARPDQSRDDESAALWRGWRAAAARPEVAERVRGLYDGLDAAVRARGPVCWSSGKCCKFESFKGGHLLYVTGLEIAWVLARLREMNHAVPAAASGPSGDACVFQAGGHCSIHAVRPLGCRVFFCQRGTQDWQREAYERFQGELRALHEGEGIEYRYMEWRAGLREAAGNLDLAQISD